MSKAQYAIVIEGAEGENLSAYVPDLPGCVTTGDTIEEIVRNMQEAIALHVASLREHGEPVPPPSSLVRTVRVELREAG